MIGVKGKSSGGGGLIIGGPARANLLPPEVGAAAHGKVVRRNAVLVVILAVILVVAGYAGAMFFALGTQAKLDDANAKTQELLAKQVSFQEVRNAKLLLATATAAQQAATSTEIDWKDYFEKIEGILPAGTSVKSINVQTATPLSIFSQPSVPLQGDRIGEVRFSATTASLPDIEKWLEALATLPGYVDAAPGSVTLGDAGTYQVDITMHINKDALLLRFDEVLRTALDEKLEAAKAAVDEKKTTSEKKSEEAKKAEDAAKSAESSENAGETEGGTDGE